MAPEDEKTPRGPTPDEGPDHHEDGTSTSTAASIKDDTAVGSSHSDEGPSRVMNHEIEALARQLMRASTTVGVELHAFCPLPGTRLDPSSPNFDARAWVKAFVKLDESEDGSAPPRSLGVAFRDLNVFGWGTGAEHQKSVVDYPLDLVKSLVGLLRPQKKRRVDILRNFEGVVEEGELLLVLGPPGSGCSTLLKTIAGETAGLEVDTQSYMNFRGKC